MSGNLSCFILRGECELIEVRRYWRLVVDGVQPQSRYVASVFNDLFQLGLQQRTYDEISAVDLRPEIGFFGS